MALGYCLQADIIIIPHNYDIFPYGVDYKYHELTPKAIC